MRIENKKRVLFVVFLLCVVLAVVLLFQLDRLLEKKEVGDSGKSATDVKNEMNTVYIDGEAYLPRAELENYLFIGLDSEGKVSDGGVAQADFIMVLSYDRKNRSYTALSVNRDTVTEVEIFDIFGKSMGTRSEQIALSHAYGSSLELSNEKKCKNTMQAVSGLLYGIKFDGYLSMTMDAVERTVNTLGGVEVQIRRDLTAIDPRFEEGVTLLMDGETAMRYIRARGGVSDSSNLARMERQEQFLIALVKKLTGNTPNEDKLLSLFESTSDCLVTDLSYDMPGIFAERIGQGVEAEFYSLPGEAMAVDGFMEFHTDKEKLKELVIKLFYEKAN